MPPDDLCALCVSYVGLKGSGFGGLCQFLLSWLGLDRIWLSGVKKSSRYHGLLPCPGWLWPCCNRLILTKVALFFLRCVQERETISSLLSTRCLAISYLSTISVCFQYPSSGYLFKVNRTFFTVLAVLSKPWISLFFNLSRGHGGLKHPGLSSISFCFARTEKEASLWNWMGAEVVKFKFSNFPLRTERDCLSLNKF